MVNKVLYFDIETTGKSPFKNDIIQIGGIVEIEGEVKEEFNLKIKPIDPNNIDDEALQVNKITREMLNGDDYDLPRTGYSKLIKIFEKYIAKFDKTDKFIPCGYSVSFDLSFVDQFFKKNGDNYFGSFVDRKMTKDPLPVLRYLKSIGCPTMSKIDSVTLVNVCKELGISLENAHDALSDIRATRELVKMIDRGLLFDLNNARGGKS